MNLKPKYDVGDVVYKAGTVTEKRQHPCPDCLGSKEWAAKSPVGTEYTFECPRCGGGYQKNLNLSLNYSVAVSSVMRLTIGSVRLNTADEKPISYMCVETGVGSGSIHYEEDLFLDEESAEQAAQIKADAQTQDTEWMVKKYNSSLSLSDFQLSNAVLEDAKRITREAQSKYGWLIPDLRDCYDMTDVARVIERLETEAA